MEVILMTRIENLGNLGDKVNVKPGFARNYLIPQHKAKFATAENIAEFEARRAELERQAEEELSQARGRHEKIHGLQISVTAKESGEGKLFGSVGSTEIIEALQAKDIAVEKREIRLPDGVFRQTGTYEVEIHLHSDINATVTLEIVGEE
jgi:large subunit ribosomal protein L9